MAKGQGRDLETSKKIESEVMILTVFVIIVILILLWFFRNDIGEVLRYLFIADGYIAKVINSISSSSFIANNRNLTLLQDYYIKTNFNGFSYDMVFSGGETFIRAAINDSGKAIFGRTTPFFYYQYINTGLLLLTIPPIAYILKKLSDKLLSSNDLTIKNKRMELFFNDKILQKSKRKVVKTSLGREFATLDYFPCYVSEEKEDIDIYVSRSIDMSLHNLNYDLKWFKDLQGVWNSILKPQLEYNKQTKKPVINTALYALVRWSYIDKESIRNNPKEKMVFVNSSNIDNPNIPEENLFTLNCSNKKIISYMRKYYPTLFKRLKPSEDIDFTDILITDLELFFEIKLFRNKKTYLNEIKKEVDTPLIYTRHLTDHEVWLEVNKIIDTPEYEHFSKVDLDKAKENLFKEQKLALVEGNKKYKGAARTYYKNLKNLTNNGSIDIRFKQPIIPRTYILNPIGAKTLNDFTTPGIKLIVDILQKYIISDYTNNIDSQIARMTKENHELARDPIENREVILENESIIIDLKASLDPSNKQSRMSSLDEIKRFHKFEETYVVALWEYATTLANLPTGRLSLIKYDNVVLWYALTSIGRPFIFNVGLPIIVMKEYENSIGVSKDSAVSEFEDANLKVSDIFDEELYKTILNESI